MGPKLLVTQDLQRLVLENPDLSKITGLVVDLAKSRAHIKEHEKHHKALGELGPTVVDAVRHGKMAVGVEYVLTKLQSVPKDPNDIPKWAEGIRNHIGDRKIKLPAALEKAVDALASVKQ